MGQRWKRGEVTRKGHAGGIWSNVLVAPSLEVKEASKAPWVQTSCLWNGEQMVFCCFLGNKWWWLVNSSPRKRTVNVTTVAPWCLQLLNDEWVALTTATNCCLKDMLPFKTVPNTAPEAQWLFSMPSRLVERRKKHLWCGCGWNVCAPQGHGQETWPPEWWSLRSGAQWRVVKSWGAGVGATLRRN